MPSLIPLHSAYLQTPQCCAVDFFLPSYLYPVLLKFMVLLAQDVAAVFQFNFCKQLS